MLNIAFFPKFRSEFAEEDRQLAEEGLDEYTELLRQEDVK